MARRSFAPTALRLPKTLIGLIITYAIALPVANSGNYAAQVVAAVLFLLYGLVMLVQAYFFLDEWIRDKIGGARALWKYADTGFSVLFTFAGVFTAIWLLDQSPAKDSQLLLDGTHPMHVFRAHTILLAHTTFVFNSGGFVRTTPISEAVLFLTSILAMTGWILRTVPLAALFVRRVAEAVRGDFLDRRFNETPVSYLSRTKKLDSKGPRKKKRQEPVTEQIFTETSAGNFRLLEIMR